MAIKKRFLAVFEVNRVTEKFKLPVKSERSVFMEARNMRRAKKKVRSVLKSVGVAGCMKLKEITEVE